MAVADFDLENVQVGLFMRSLMANRMDVGKLALRDLKAKLLPMSLDHVLKALKFL